MPCSNNGGNAIAAKAAGGAGVLIGYMMNM